MNLPRQHYQILYYDHREDPPRRQFKSYADPKEYRRDLAQLRAAADGYSQSTQTTLHLYPAEKGQWLRSDDILEQ